ncbi:ADP-ribosylglycohydrolase family protein [Amycolatopsis antarctica]|uniref:ADP-ribosylglycohydrolase family protein n=1 Tax=Amycolatopsis antarctica TaxID=1854586 RepID=UPI0013FD80AE|nr:ADP-ribosylglycohydrolase family protein [Amycolatopsis antarctica]
MVRSLRALVVGDAFGAAVDAVPRTEGRTLPPGRWEWTDDSEMAYSIAGELAEHHHVEQDSLVRRFAERHDARRGYGRGTTDLLRRIRGGAHWRLAASESFGGRGSWGNGAAMRVAPLGAWFASDPGATTSQAALSAEVTHSHAEAIAVAAATAAVSGPDTEPAEFLGEVATVVRGGPVRDRILRTGRMTGEPANAVAAAVGNGAETRALDTVPFAIWCAATHLADFREAMWTAASVGGDRDTICAMVGGIIGNTAEIPERWWAHCEPPPPWTILP